MFCEKCGHKIDDGAKFCTKCGHRLVEVKKTEENLQKEAVQNNKPKTDVDSASTSNKENETAAKKNDSSNQTPLPKKAGTPFMDKVKTIPKVYLIGGGALLLALIIGLVVFLKMGSTLNLNDYVVVETSGYDGYGTARVSVDWEKMKEKYGKKLSFTSEARKEYGSWIQYMSPMDLVMENVYVSLDTSSGLSNGDKIAYTWQVDEDLFDYVKGTIEYEDASYTVKGLKEVGKFDAFENLEVIFSGVGPNGSVDWSYAGDELSAYDFYCDTTNGLSNGDVITIYIDDSNIEYYAENLGKVPEPSQKEYTVQGLGQYITSADMLSKETLSAMQQQAYDVFHAHAAKNWDEYEKIESFAYAGNYLLKSKSAQTWGTNNIFYLIYKVQVRNNFSNDNGSYNKVKDYYWFIRYDDVIVAPDGTCDIDLSAYSTPRDTFDIDSGVSTGWWSTKSWYYYGYEDLEVMERRLITENLDNYTYEKNLDSNIVTTVPEENELPEEPVNESGYVLPNSDTQLLTKADLEGLTAEECKLARNEIYARHGRKFKDEALQSYFDSCEWYEGTIEPDDFEESMLNEIEVENKNIIVEFEKEKGYR